jgi:DNA modification methylase
MEIKHLTAMESKNIQLLHGDCLEKMKDIADGSVDMVLCDLPFGTTKNKWDSIIPLDRLWEEYNRIIKDNGAIVLFSQVPFNIILGASNISMLKYEWIYKKTMPTGRLNCNYAPMKAHENILVFSKSAACFVRDKTNAMTYNPQFRSGKPYISIKKNIKTSNNYDTKWQRPTTTENDGSHYYPTDIIEFKLDKEKYHPTQKPVALLEYLIKTYSNEGELILDNCMGSGSTGVAAVNTNRRFIGIELDKKYYDISCKRIKKR